MVCVGVRIRMCRFPRPLVWANWYVRVGRYVLLCVVAHNSVFRISLQCILNFTAMYWKTGLIIGWSPEFKIGVGHGA